MTTPDQKESPSLARASIFATTHWNVVIKAAGKDSEERNAALEKLCSTYWPPVFVILRREGCSENDAKDFTQQFFMRLIERNDFRTVDASKGKFRSFIRAALMHFLSNERDRMRAAKRGGGRMIVSLDSIPLEQLQSLGCSNSIPPDKLFDFRWAVTVLSEAVSKLQEEMTKAGKREQFEKLKGFLTAEPRLGEYAEVANHLAVKPQAVAVAVHRLRQRYGELVRSEIASTVSSPAEVEEEMRDLHAALGL
jgi:ECF sigma factor